MREIILENHHELIIGDSPSETALELARNIKGYLTSLSREKSRLYLALSGGSTPKMLYELLATKAEFSRTVPWQQVHLFWVDERWVLPDHPQSNYRLVKETLLDSVPIPASQVHPMPVVKYPPVEAKVEYEKVMREEFALPLDTEGLPSFDLVLLGMGEDGHTASIFPGETAQFLAQTSSWVECPYVSKINSHRMTLTPLVLNAAKEAWFLVTGKHKAATLKKVLQGDHDPVHLPAQMIHLHGKVIKWFVDIEAVSQLDL